MVQEIFGKDDLVGEGTKFERIRRITGYLVGKLERFNNAKRDEEHDRVKHGLGSINQFKSKATIRLDPVARVKQTCGCLRGE